MSAIVRNCVMTTPTAVAESLVDAKDEARQAEVRTDIASALLKIHEDRMFFVKWIVGTGVGVVGILVAVLALLR